MIDFCEHCGNRFNHRKDLNRHVRSNKKCNALRGTVPLKENEKPRYEIACKFPGCEESGTKGFFRSGH